MAYTTYAEVLAITGTALPQTTVEAIIALSDLEVDSVCARAGVTASATDPAIRTAGVNLAVAAVLTRYRMDGTKESSTLEWQDRTNVDAAIATYRKQAYEALESYTNQNKSAFYCEVANL